MKVLILCPSEICYNPRLLKAADFLFANGAEVTVYNAVTGVASEKVYEAIKAGRDWRIVENKITKAGPIARLRWLYSSLVNKLAVLLFKRNKLPRALFPHVMSKGYVLFPGSLKKIKFDYILIHLVDSLPFAAGLKDDTGARLIYDSQEYFKGQYETESPYLKKWVDEAEGRYAAKADIVLAPTNVMLQRLRQDFAGPKIFLRVRNTPLRKPLQVEQSNHPGLKIIWHGMSVIPRNIRGVHILLEAVSLCRTPVMLYLQGNITEDDRVKLETMLREMGIVEKVRLLEPADPDKIVESLKGYDIGALGELAAQDNQRLTSSNKLFEYIYAGLAVLAPDLSGISETINEYSVGLLYTQGDSRELAQKIDQLNADRTFLGNLKEASLKAGRAELFWENDYKKVLDAM